VQVRLKRRMPPAPRRLPASAGFTPSRPDRQTRTT